MRNDLVIDKPDEIDCMKKTIVENVNWRKREARLKNDEIEDLLKKAVGWRLTDGAITKDFKFMDFRQAINFINRVAKIAEHENHHPEILLWDISNVKLKITTYCVRGLSQLDFSLASQVDLIATKNNKTPQTSELDHS